MSNFKWKVKKELYQRGQCTSPDMVIFYSYCHWQFTKYFEDVLIFNDYFYSMTTSKHQCWARREINNYFTINTRMSLSNLTSIDIIALLKDEKANLQLMIPKGRGLTNEKRIDRLTDINKMISKLSDRTIVV